ncbi:acylpyruvase FAHD1, mitochondrial-like isoform X1 [Ctenocephalides felis]|uniref:acylpyruvase FAHD1, mitochondrial-like n=1 Tax=Ctenocephalides felis TaxID=7515 RepID=UPI000E6E31A9|nr:acylpyruvase FAHD1, mitochondrial-like [Ctenocephalides felis]XP_026477352.1 acylpyruvase FAHD1, mitochondrial-like isoform X1 [Ctenocephalides felis]
MTSAQLQNFVKNGKVIIGAGLNYKSALPPGRSRPSVPVIFTKPTSCYIVEGQEIELNPHFKDVKHEIELGVIIGKRCKNVSEKEAMDYVGGYCLGLDMTAACYLSESMKHGLPWALSKSFDTSNPVSRFVSTQELPNPHDVRLWCKVNGLTRQDSTTADLIFTIPELISYCSKFMTLEPCDLIMTGTPQGVGSVNKGDIIEGGLGDFLTMTFYVKK